MKTIKVIDLLNMLANKDKNLPKKIKECDNQIYQLTDYNDGEFLYYENDEEILETDYSSVGLNSKLEILEEPILDDKEKEYLSNVIRPFRNRIKYIMKTKGDFNLLEYILIESDYINDNDTCFPSFEAGAMYKGMELDKEYTIEELGL